MKKPFFKLSVLSFTMVLLGGCGSGDSESDAKTELKFKTEELLGEALFSDVNLSKNRTQSCATCHAPANAFVDPRQTMISGVRDMASLGDDNTSIGDRNTPTASYAKFSPDFEANATRQRHSKKNGFTSYTGAIGGQFHDGRELDLKAQAGGPPVNPIEMGMDSKEAVLERIKENTDYVAAFESFYGTAIFDNTEQAYFSMTQAIGKFEKTDEFSPFDSRYDLYLDDPIKNPFTFKELTGKSLFFSQFMNCAMCHQLNANSSKTETFSGYEYHNIGVPENSLLRSFNGETKKDLGLMLNNAFANDATAKGKFKTPTLRNVAVTGPYMHNGVFKDLKTVVAFYDHFVNSDRNLNPETGQAWKAPEVNENLAAELTASDKLTDYQLESLVCFMKTLTDQRYVEQLPDDGVNCD